MKHKLRHLAPIFDFLICPFILLASPILYAVCRLRSKAPISRKILNRFGLALVRYHYYEPIVFPSDIWKSLHDVRELPGLNLNEPGQLALLKEFKYREELLAIPLEKPSISEFGYHNLSFESGDAEYLYNIVRYFRPRRIIEIGSGHSTLMANIAIGRNKSEDPSYDCQHICIEPFEQPWLETLGIRVVRERVECTSSEIFRSLEKNDLLFIDSSHVIRPQGDVLHEYLYLLPLLNSGVIVHVHDVFIPRDYPADWVIKDRRMWNEQYILEAFLTLNSDFEVIGAVNWLHQNHPDKLIDACPVLLQQPSRQPGSFWFRRR